MKKSFATLFIRFFLVFIIFLFTTTVIKAQQEASQAATPTPVQYTLPYPGLLPDHPLWFVKAIRDKIISFLISDPLKKSDFNLKQADKRLTAGAALIEKGKISDGISSISKGENYFEQAVKDISLAKAGGSEVKTQLDTFLTASRKHQEIILELEQKVAEDVSVLLQKERERAEQFEKDVEKLKLN